MKGYYSRRQIKVIQRRPAKENEKEMAGEDAAEETFLVDAYFKVQSSVELREAEFQQEYTLEMHKRLYRAIRHIQVKQEMYLGVAERT